MDILGLSTSPSSGGAYALILNEIDGARRLPIIIGTYEAQAIALELEHIKPPRPMTHDLLKQFITTFQANLRYVNINALREGTFFAQIVIENDIDSFEVDARPSDAIALAIRFNAPIYVAEQVLKEAGIESEPIGEEGAPKKEKSRTTKSSDVEKPSSHKSGTIETRTELLEKNLAAAIAAEDYELAARLRDEIIRMKG